MRRHVEFGLLYTGRFWIREGFRHAMPVEEGVGEGELSEGAASGGGAWSCLMVLCLAVDFRELSDSALSCSRV